MAVSLTPPSKGRAPAWVKLVWALWAAVIVAVTAAVIHYEITPGRAGPSPPRWPAGSQIARASGQMQVLMFAHPRCGCTRASLEELYAALKEAPDLAAVTVVIAKPDGVDLEWVQGDVMDAAAKIPNVGIMIDEGGKEAERFGARTSGHVFAYDAAGGLLYTGGITAARGHVGDSSSRQALVAALRDGRPAGAMTSTFGCDIREPGEPRGD